MENHILCRFFFAFFSRFRFYHPLNEYLKKHFSLSHPIIILVFFNVPFKMYRDAIERVARINACDQSLLRHILGLHYARDGWKLPIGAGFFFILLQTHQVKLVFSYVLSGASPFWFSPSFSSCII